MKKSILLLLAILPWLCPSLCAQVWCPPGATWYFGFDYKGSNGYNKYTYEGDTVIGGITEQIIGNERHSYLQDPPGYHVVVEEDIRTRMANGVLYTFHNPPGSQSGAAWDTLIWYSAVPGDHWQVLQPDDFQCETRFQVTDTGHTELAGMNLRYVQTTVMEDGSELGTRRFLERIGSVHDTFRGECLEVEADTALRCYQDSEMNYAPPAALPCDFMVGIADFAVQAQLHLFPNPGTDQVTFQGPFQVAKAEFMDRTGRICLKAELRSGSATVDVSTLAPGVYLVRLRGHIGFSNAVFVKQ